MSNLIQHVLSGQPFRTVLADPPWRFDHRRGKVSPEHRRLNRLLSMHMDAVGIPVQIRGEHWSGPSPLACVQVGASTSTAACRGLPARQLQGTATASARQNERREGVVT